MASIKNTSSTNNMSYSNHLLFDDLIEPIGHPSTSNANVNNDETSRDSMVNRQVNGKVLCVSLNNDMPSIMTKSSPAVLATTTTTPRTPKSKSIGKSFDDSLDEIKPSYFFSNFDENGYVFDGIKIEIDDIVNNSMSNLTTTQSLKRCKCQVLRLFYYLLCFIGWRPFYKEYYYRTPKICGLINFVYPLLIIALLFYSYVYDIMTCQGKLNVAIDVQSVTPLSIMTASPINATKSTTLANLTTVKFAIHLPYFLAHNKSGNLSSIFHGTSQNLTPAKEHCGHVVTTYIVPSLMHLISYILGFVYFRINENEQLYALMEKVFLAVNQSLKIISQDRVIKRLRIFFFLGVLWVMMAMSLQILFRAAYGFETEPYQPSWAFIVLQSIALIIMNSVYLAVVINHATQCELIMFYVHEIKTRLEEKSIGLKEAIQEILEIRMAIGNLNSTVSKMTTLVALTFIEKFIIGLVILIMNQDVNPIAWTYRAVYPISWFVVLAFTVIQVSRLNSRCSKFKQIALSSRVYGYHASTRDELDSFILFVSNAKLTAKLFGIALKPSYLLVAMIFVSFTIMFLFQTSIITSPQFFI